MSLADELYRSLYGNQSFTQRPQPPLFKPVISPLPSQIVKVTKPKIFVSYHHKDQAHVNKFITDYAGLYEVFTDCSLDEAVESNDLDYVNRTIREEFITGTSTTIVICGNETWRRMCVDWEIYSTLHKEHALLGIVLPHVKPVLQNNQWMRLIPDRLHANITSGYAHWIEYPNNAHELSRAINNARQRSTNYKHMKNNSALKMKANIQ